MKKIILFISLLSVQIFAQEFNSGTNSFFDDGQLKEYIVDNILLQGEVENPGIVDISGLPEHSFPVKDLSYGRDKNRFNGAYFFSGYSLFDILNLKNVKKINRAEFKPLVDLYVVVENDKGDKAVFSWGEIFYSKDNFKVIISISVRAINPEKMKMKWPLPDGPVLVCGNDAYNFRFLSNPKKITVKSFQGIFSMERVAETYVPEITIKHGNDTVILNEISGFEKRKFHEIGYGHGMGWKGIEDVEGCVFSDILKAKLKLNPQDTGSTLVSISAKDGYRVTFSLSELINRNDMNDFLLSEVNGNTKEGKFNLFATPDFYVDRNVRSVEKIEFLKIN